MRLACCCLRLAAWRPARPATAPPLPPPPSPAPGPRHTDSAALLGQLLGADGQDRQEQDPQSQEVARLTTELARQQELFALLVDRVAPGRNPAPGQASARPEPAPLEPGDAVGRDAINRALLDELVLLKTASAGLPAPPATEEDATEAGAPGGAQLPLARPAPPLSDFDPEGDVTQTGADSFWKWLDAVPRTPWTAKGPYAEWAAKGPYAEWAAKVQYVQMLSTFVARAAPEHLEAAAGRRAKKALVDALARACADAARVRACSGPSGGASARGPTVLDRLRRSAGAG